MYGHIGNFGSAADPSFLKTNSQMPSSSFAKCERENGFRHSSDLKRQCCSCADIASNYEIIITECLGLGGTKKDHLFPSPLHSQELPAAKSSARPGRPGPRPTWPRTPPGQINFPLNLKLPYTLIQFY